MTFHYTLYWIDSLGRNRVLTDFHSSDPSTEIVKWFDADFTKDGFVTFLQSFLRSKTSWCCELGGLLIEQRNTALVPFFGNDVINYDGCLMECTIADLKTLLDSERSTAWYWPFPGHFVGEVEQLVQSSGYFAADIEQLYDEVVGENKRKKKIGLDEIKVLFHF